MMPGLVDSEDRGFGVQRVEDRLDEQEVNAAVEKALRRLFVGIAELVKGDFRKPGFSTPGEIDAVRLVGPSAPATSRGRPGRTCPRAVIGDR
jgi:hypothetical protein